MSHLLDINCRLNIGLHRALQRTEEGTTEINVIRGGPNQLLQWVETQLGLNGPKVAWTDRVVAYHKALTSAAGNTYARSLHADAWATASNLLKRRDELLIAGWTPLGKQPHPFAADLAAIEPFDGPPGVPERIRCVLEWLDKGLQLPPHDLVLDETIESWPKLWNDLLSRLQLSGQPLQAANGKGALKVIQSNLLSEAAEATEVDDSLLALRSASRHSAVQFLARWMKDRDVTVYCPDQTLASMLDSALVADGQPSMGVPRRSRAKPAYQILPLILQLLWAPVNPYVLLDFLSLPIGPMRSVTYHLSRALESQPGYQSDAWNTAIEKIREKDTDGKETAKISKWLDHKRFPLGEDLPTSVVEERCRLVAQWTTIQSGLESKQESPDFDLVDNLLTAANQANALSALCTQLGPSISAAQLERLLDEIRNTAGTDVPLPAQAGGALFVSSLIDVPITEHLVWLGTQASESSSAAWTTTELNALRKAGVDLGAATSQRARRAGEAQGLARAKKLLVIDVEADESRRHPLWLRIHGDLIIHGERGGKLPQIEQLLHAGKLPVKTREVDQSKAPEVRVIWDAGQSIPLPTYTSATALEDQLSCPLKWTLRHALKMRGSSISNIPNDWRLKGLFAHELMELVFLPGPPPTVEDATRKVSELFDDLLPRNAAPLAIPRKLPERTRLRTDLIAAVRQFAKTLIEERYEVVGLEVSTQGSDFDGVPIYGSIDCVLRDSTGETIVDFKLGGGTKFEQKVEQGRALQLATYSHTRDKPVVGAAYFVLTTSKSITPAGGPMRGSSNVVTGPSISSTWERFADALRQASSWMSDGMVVARPLQDPSEWAPGTNLAIDMDDTEPACSYCDYANLCGRRPLN